MDGAVTICPQSYRINFGAFICRQKKLSFKYSKEVEGMEVRAFLSCSISFDLSRAFLRNVIERAIKKKLAFKSGYSLDVPVARNNPRHLEPQHPVRTKDNFKYCNLQGV